MVEKLDAFGDKLDLFHVDLMSGRLLHCYTLKAVGESNVTDKMKKFITQLKENFSARFDDFVISRDVIGFVHDIKAALCDAESLSTFWVACPQDSGTLKTSAVYGLTMFGSTDNCKAVFSKMNSIKTHERNQLSNQSLEDSLRISMTAAKPDVKKLASEEKGNFSH